MGVGAMCFSEEKKNIYLSPNFKEKLNLRER
jgi:hypothetical protein